MIGEKRYDGAIELSKISGLSRESVMGIWEEVKENKRRLDSCARHRFPEQESVKMGQRFTCLECGGEMHLGDIGNYVKGHAAAGGNADDVWPGWSKGKTT